MIENRWLEDSDDKGAMKRAGAYLNVDPYPDIPRALLSKEHIVQYARQTAMIFPAYGINKKTGKDIDGALKSASYETRPGLFVIHYDKSGKLRRESFSLDAHGVIRIPANSITFVTTRDRFFLPNYIAMRFNLRIKHVHRGLLLGTGPLVDPGYDKEILIPLHNLTDSDYHISLDEGLIWVEFTKTSALHQGESASLREIVLDGDPAERGLAKNTRKDIEEYLFKANAGGAIRSSIPKAILQAEASATKAAKRVQVLQNIGILALISLAIGLVSVFVSILSLITTSQNAVRDLSNRVSHLERNGQ
jgi:deoxycytidine triphosphate deaminase